MPFIADRHARARARPSGCSGRVKSVGVTSFMSFDLVLFEPVRSAEPPIVSGTAGLITSSAISDDLARRDLRPRRRRACACSRRSPRRSRAAARRGCGARTRRAVSRSSAARRFFHSLRGWLRLRPAIRHASRISAGHLEGGYVPAERLPGARRSPRRRAASRGTDALPALVGAPKPMVVRQAIIVGRSVFCARPRSPRRSRPDRVPSMRRRIPARRLEARHLVAGFGERQRAVDRNAVVVEEDDQLAEPQVPGDRDRLVADALHQVAVGGDHIGVVVDDVVAEAGRDHALGDRHADGIAEPLAERAGGGLDACA